MNLYIYERVVIDTAFSAGRSNNYASELVQIINGREDSNFVRIKLGLIPLIHYTVVSPFIARTAGASFQHQYLIGIYEAAKNDLSNIVGAGSRGIVDRAIQRAEQIDDQNFQLFLGLFKHHLSFFEDKTFIDHELFVSIKLVEEVLKQYRRYMDRVNAEPTETYTADNRISERSFSLVKFKESINAGLITENLIEAAITKASSTSFWLLNKPRDEQLRLVWRAMRERDENRRESLQERDRNLLMFAENDNIQDESEYDNEFHADDDCL